MANFNYVGSTDTLYILQKLKNVLDGYVKKDGTKQLSDENFTTVLLNKLNGISEDADNVAWNQTVVSGTKIATITINGTPIDIYVPAGITVDSEMSDVSVNPVQNRVIKDYVDTAIGSITTIEFLVVQTLPATGENGIIYLVPNGGVGTNSYDEYVWVSSEQVYEKIGTTDVDLSGYVQTTDLAEVSTSQIDQIFITVFGN